MLPLRVCTDCYTVLEQLDTFQNKCLMVEKQIKLHLSLEQDIEKRKSLFSPAQVPAVTPRMIQNVKNSLQKYLQDHEPGTSSAASAENTM